MRAPVSFSAIAAVSLIVASACSGEAPDSAANVAATSAASPTIRTCEPEAATRALTDLVASFNAADVQRLGALFDTQSQMAYSTEQQQVGDHRQLQGREEIVEFLRTRVALGEKLSLDRVLPGDHDSETASASATGVRATLASGQARRLSAKVVLSCRSGLVRNAVFARLGDP